MPRSPRTDVNSINIPAVQPETTLATEPHTRLETFSATEAERVLRAALIDDAVAARRVLRSVLDDGKALNKDRIKAGIHLLSLAGYVPPRSVQHERPPAQLADMTTEQLRKVLDQAESELAERAKPVDAQGSAQDDSEATDML